MAEIMVALSSDDQTISVPLATVFGTGIARIEQTVTSDDPEIPNEITCTLTNGQQSKFYIKNGKDGYSPSITIEQGAEGYSITVTDEEGSHEYSIIVDSTLDAESANPIQNQAVAGAVTQLTSDITAEVTRATNAETAIRTEASQIYATKAALQSEESARSLADTSLSNNIDAETQRATQAEASIQSAIPNKTSQLTNDSGFLTSAPVSSVNGKSGAVNLSASDVGALPSSTVIPSKTSDLTNDSHFITASEAPVQSVNGQTGAVTIPTATTSSAGLMSSQDKANLDAVRVQYTELKNAINNVSHTEESYNIFHAYSVTNGKYYNPSNGNYGNNDSYCAVDDYLEVNPSTDYIFTYGYEGSDNKKYRAPFIPTLYCWYDSSKTFISGGQNPTGGLLTSPSNAKYLRVSFSASNLTRELMIAEGPVSLPYVEYGSVTQIKKHEPFSAYYNGTSNLKNFLNSLNATKEYPYNVYIPEGEYNTLSWFTADEQAENDFVGFFVPDYITLIGMGSRENVIFTASFASRNKLVSVINLAGTSGLKNLTVIGTMTRYGVHDDFAYRFNSDETYERNVENCHFKAIDCYYQNSYGSGYKNGCKAVFKNCKFESNAQKCFGWHSGNYSGTIAGDFTYENCEFVSRSIPSLCFGGMVSGLTHKIHLIGCKFQSLEMREELTNSGSGLDFDIDGYGNTKNFIENVTVTDGKNYFTKFTDTVLIATCAGTVTKGDLLYRSGAYFAKIGKSMSVNRVCGIALEDGTNNNPLHVKTGGIVPISLLGLESVSVGNLIGVSNGVATVIASGDYIGRAISATDVELVSL